MNTDHPLYTIQAYAAGIGWLTFHTTRDVDEIDDLEAQARDADNKLYPGQAPRRTRVLADGAVLPAKVSKLFTDSLFV